MDGEALTLGFAALLATFVYGLLGWRLWHRPVSSASRLPASQFGVFWFGLAVVSLISGIDSVLAAFFSPPFALVLTGLFVQILVLCVLLWGLLGYLLFLFLGREFVLLLSILYAAAYVLLLYAVVQSGPTAVTVVFGQVGVNSTTAVGGLLAVVLVMFLIVPELAGSFAYFTLFFRTRDRTVRFRVTVVSWSLILWFGLSTLHVERLFGPGLVAQLASSALGTFAAFAIYLAYYPPVWIRQRLRVERVEPAAGGFP